MATDNRLRNRVRPSSFLPAIGMDVPVWLQDWLIKIRTPLEKLMETPDLPGAPTRLATTAESVETIVLYWTAAPNAVRYRIYQNGTPSFADAVIKGETTSLSFLDSRASVFPPAHALWVAGLTYYWVTAFNSAGVEGTPGFLRVSLASSNLVNTGSAGNLNLRAEDTGTSIVFTTSQADRARFDDSGWLVLREVTTNPTAADLTVDNEVALYRKSDTLAIAYNSTGTIYFLTIPLDGSTTSWTVAGTGP